MGSGFLAEKDFPRLAKAAGRIHEAPLFLDDTLHLDLINVIAKVRSSNDKKINLVIIDAFSN
jgi:replicative DNA helicase